MNTQQKQAADRREQVVGMRKDGLTYAAIGLRLGISKERVRQILNSSTSKRAKISRTSRLLRTSDAARLLKIHTNTVRRWSNKGILKAYRIGSRGDRRFRRKDINSLLS